MSAWCSAVPHIFKSSLVCLLHSLSTSKKKTEKKTHHTRWTIRGPVMSLSCWKLLPILPFICQEIGWLILLQPWPGFGFGIAEMWAINFPVPNRGTHTVKTTKLPGWEGFQGFQDRLENLLLHTLGFKTPGWGGISTTKTYLKHQTSGGIWKAIGIEPNKMQWIKNPNKNQRLHWGVEQVLPALPNEFKGNSLPPIKFHSVQIGRYPNRKKERNHREKRKGLKFTDLNPQSPSEKDT